VPAGGCKSPSGEGGWKVVVNAQDVRLLREKTGAGIMDCKKALVENGGDFDKAIKYLREKGLADAKKKSGREARDGRITITSSEDGNSILMIEVNCETDFVSRTKEYADFVDNLARALLEKNVGDIENVPAQIQDSVKNGISSFGENIILRRIALFAKTDKERNDFSFYIHMDGKVGVMVEYLFDTEELASKDEMQEFKKNVALQIASMDPLSVSREDFPKVLLEEQKEIFLSQAKDSGKPDHILEKIVTGKMSKFFTDLCLLEQKYVKDDKLSVKKYLQDIEEKVGGHIEITRFVRFKLGEE
jgi:elongation factor Ts